MRQKTLSQEGFERFRKATRREQFLDEMNEIIPWKELAEAIEPFYLKGDGPGRPPIGIFRHLMEANNLGDRLFVLIQDYLQENGLKITRGTIVDATIISAPSSTKNREGKREPEMHQTRKDNQWYLGMKAHVGVDSKTKLIHAVTVIPANVHDSQVLPILLHGTETPAWGDSAYTGQGETIRRHAPRAKDFTQKKSHRHRPLTEGDRSRNRNKSRVRAKVEPPLLILKRIFAFSKVRYRGIHKNATRLFVACVLVNLFMARRVLLHPT